MSAMDEKTHDTSSEDPEKVAELSAKPSYGEGDVKDPRFVHADPNDGDVALMAFQGHEGETIVMTPEMEKKLLRKIDLNLMPV
jgi:ACS family allantoate permease-like MFS transporter